MKKWRVISPEVPGWQIDLNCSKIEVAFKRGAESLIAKKKELDKARNSKQPLTTFGVQVLFLANLKTEYYISCRLAGNIEWREMTEHGTFSSFKAAHKFAESLKEHGTNNALHTWVKERYTEVK